MKLIVIFIFLFVGILLIKEQTFKASDKMTYEQALVLSKEHNKSIMLKLTAENCKYCIKMDKEVLANPEVEQFLFKHFISVTINVDREVVPLGIEHNITPTFIFVNKDEEILSKLPGSWNKKDFMDLLNNRI
ncbi:MAG: Unknown protein [uncultured Sulfurovum sp.]|uniref:Thioredoxin-like fold domain-containing protein n=1 Tax=uncultured Sulfurovum sp. TaxID=269237 RepID=A0A6S6TDR5_9BACT|nr:MAG: Unknown protein [uncultured Sulfurovum sp.]